MKQPAECGLFVAFKAVPPIAAAATSQKFSAARQKKQRHCLQLRAVALLSISRSNEQGERTVSYLLSTAAYLDPQRARDLSAFDATLRAIHEAAQDADTIAGERSANEDWLQEQFLDAASSGIATHCHFAKLPSGKVPTFGDVLLETLVESNRGLDQRLMALVLAAAKDGNELALSLLTDASKEFARSAA